jgi:hypothetical protein
MQRWQQPMTERPLLCWIILNMQAALLSLIWGSLFVVVLGAFTSVLTAYSLGFAVNFAIQILVFSISLSIYEKNGD